MNEAVTKFIRYLFLDIVAFTKNRSVEAQTDIVNTLNTLVRSAVTACSLPSDKLLFLPTGDGMGIAIIDEALPYDVHLELALHILADLNDYNSRTTDPMRKFAVRSGLNQNVDNLITDINGGSNVAGAGINEAQRIMNAADASQLMVGSGVFDTLKQRERYMKSFRGYRARIKHNLTMPVYQFVTPHPGLSVEVPSQFATALAAPKKLTRLNAYYLAHSFANRGFLLSHNGSGQQTYALLVLLWFLATDSLGEENATEYNKAQKHIYGDGNLSLDKVFTYYCEIDFWVCHQLSGYIIGEISEIVDMSESSGYPGCIFFNDKARDKLRIEHPDIWNALKLREI